MKEQSLRCSALQEGSSAVAWLGPKVRPELPAGQLTGGSVLQLDRELRRNAPLAFRVPDRILANAAGFPKLTLGALSSDRLFEEMPDPRHKAGVTHIGVMCQHGRPRHCVLGHDVAYQDGNEMRGEEIRALRESLGVSQRTIAKLIGSNQQTIQRIEAGETQHSRVLTHLLAILKNKDLFARTLKNYNKELDIAKNYGSLLKDPLVDESEDDQSPSSTDFMARNERVEKTFRPDYITFYTLSEEGGKQYFVSKPSGLVTTAPIERLATKSFGVYVSSRLMEPELEIGDIAYVDGSLPPIPNCTCLFTQGSEPHEALFARLLDYDDRVWKVRNWAAETVSELPRDLFSICRRVVGKLSRK